jgi:hypothetical protein
VQGLGAHPFYTWVRKVSAQDAKQKTKEKTGPKRLSRLFGKKSKVLGDHGERETREVMWLRDLLAPAFSNARIATYSYRSDWRDRQVNTSLRECGQQLLEVLLQHRQGASVRGCATSCILPLTTYLPHLVHLHEIDWNQHFSSNTHDRNAVDHSS